MSVVNQQELFEMAECGQQGKLVDWLRQNKIKFTYTNKKHIVTTLDCINKGLQGESEEVLHFGQE